MIRPKVFSAFIFLSILGLSHPSFAQQPKPVAPSVAPFATDANSQSSGSQLMGIYDAERQEDVVPLDRPHRTNEQIATWVEDNVTTALNIDVTQWDAHLKKVSPEFDAYALKQYTDYLGTNGILDLLKANHLRLNAIADGSAVLLSEGALSGTYHWLYQIPMMLSYYDQDTKGLKRGQTAQNRKIMVRIQLGRVQKGMDDNNIVIERWSVTPIR